jgi:pimeloyl-ACP methyl ester carboxylesterase
LRRIKAPTQIIHGKQDTLLHYKGGIDSARWIKGAELEIIDGMGHDLPAQLLPRLAELIVYNASRNQARPHLSHWI